jgi:hypothetical protein
MRHIRPHIMGELPAMRKYGVAHENFLKRSDYGTAPIEFVQPKGSPIALRSECTERFAIHPLTAGFATAVRQVFNGVTARQPRFPSKRRPYSVDETGGVPLSMKV